MLSDNDKKALGAFITKLTKSIDEESKKFGSGSDHLWGPNTAKQCQKFLGKLKVYNSKISAVISDKGDEKHDATSPTIIIEELLRIFIKRHNKLKDRDARKYLNGYIIELKNLILALDCFRDVQPQQGIEFATDAPIRDKKGNYDADIFVNNIIKERRAIELTRIKASLNEVLSEMKSAFQDAVKLCAEVKTILGSMPSVHDLGLIEDYIGRDYDQDITNISGQCDEVQYAYLARLLSHHQLPTPPSLQRKFAAAIRVSALEQQVPDDAATQALAFSASAPTSAHHSHLRSGRGVHFNDNPVAASMHTAPVGPQLNQV